MALLVSRKEVALKFGIHDPTCISHWMRIFEKKKMVKGPFLTSVKHLSMKTDNELNLEDRIALLEYDSKWRSAGKCTGRKGEWDIKNGMVNQAYFSNIYQARKK